MSCSVIFVSQRLHVVQRPELLHPFASAIDSPELEEPAELVSDLSNQ